MMARRPYSPAPRRSAQLPRDLLLRPAYDSRSSSLSQLSRENTSADSDTKRTQNSTHTVLKPQIAPPTDIEDPLDVLHTIIGSVSGEGYVNSVTKTNGESRRPDKLVEDIDFHGASLEEFAGIRALSESDPDGPLDEHIIQSIEQCEYV